MGSGSARHDENDQRRRIRERLHPIYQRLNLKEDIEYDRQQVYDFITRTRRSTAAT